MKFFGITAAVLSLLTACGGNEDRNTGVTAEESVALNDTENMLDVSPDSLAATEDAPLGNGEVPVDMNAAPATELPEEENAVD